MAKSSNKETLEVVLQVRVSRDGALAVRKAADEQKMTMAVYMRQAIYRAAKVIR